jgi:hypothetical protein
LNPEIKLGRACPLVLYFPLDPLVFILLSQMETEPISSKPSFPISLTRPFRFFSIYLDEMLCMILMTERMSVVRLRIRKRVGCFRAGTLVSDKLRQIEHCSIFSSTPNATKWLLVLVLCRPNCSTGSSMVKPMPRLPIIALAGCHGWITLVDQAILMM